MEPAGQAEGAVHIWVQDADQIAAPELERMARAAGEGDRLATAARRGAWRDRLLSRLLVRAALSARTGLPPAAWLLEKDALGRPRAAAPGARSTPGLGFSLSHTAGLVACAVAPFAEIGVDVEPLARPVDVEGVAALCCSPAERRRLDALPAPLRPRRLLELWTLKEAYLKALGTGLLPATARAASFRLDERGGGPELEDGGAAGADGWRFAQHAVAGTHLLALAWRPPAGARTRVHAPAEARALLDGLR